MVLSHSGIISIDLISNPRKRKKLKILNHFSKVMIRPRSLVLTQTLEIWKLSLYLTNSSEGASKNQQVNAAVA